MAEALDCGDVKTDQGLTTGMALHKLVPVARTRARKVALENAKDAALGKALLYRCQDRECPRLKLTIWLGEPFDGVDPPIPMAIPIIGGVGLLWTAHCYWKVRVRCSPQAIPGGQQEMKAQDLACDTGEAAEARGRVMGNGDDPDKELCLEEAIKGGLERALQQISDAIDKVTCPGDCPHKKITVLINGPIGNAVGPDKHDWFECTSQGSWYVKVSCY